ncbi:unnamed protein product [Caenorhabditis angaria]|uniref:Protein BCCIP homolog n=1 Tax=Caenorhabditis angaria TaxID=860376 RepID=A0A9P1IC61_9PELO|nr:unnamed protein product [Caenorhabditis angaria]
MGRVFKKNQTKKRQKEEEEEVSEQPVLKKKKEETPEVEEELEDEEIDDEEFEDEEEIDDEEEDEEELEDEDGEENEEILNFDFEGFPMEEEDRDGIVNMLTQTFLRTDIDLKEFAETLINQKSIGSVIGPADDEADEDDTHVVYGVCSTLPIDNKNQPKFVKDIQNYLTTRAKKSASKEVQAKIEQFFGDDDSAIFVNERMLNFPHLVVPHNFSAIRSDLEKLKKSIKTVMYIQKIRVSDKKPENGESSGGPSKSKRKMGKAEKKRMAAQALAESNIEFDNIEDKLLFDLKPGNLIHFDFAVHMDVEPGSKFHITEKDGQKWNPFRRLVIMDYKRFDAFLQRGMQGI